MASRSHALALIGLLLASLVIAGAWVYALSLSHTRHELGGASFGPQGNSTLVVVEERAEPYRPLSGGDTVRVEADSRAYISVGLDLYAVPAGQGKSFLTDRQHTILAHQPPVPRLGLFYPTPSNTTIVGGRGAATFDLDPIFQAIVPEGANGLDLVWVNATNSVPKGELHLLEYQTTWTNSHWETARPLFLGAEGLLSGASLVCLAVWARRSTQQEPRPEQDFPGALPAITRLVESAGLSLRRLRDAYLALGILLLVGLSYAQKAIDASMEDSFVGQVLASKATTDAAHWGFWCGSAVIVVAWGFLLWRAQVDLKRWHAFMAKGPFTP